MRTEIANDGVIILGSCHAGLDDEEGEKSVAQHIANLTHRKVIAARGLMMPFDTVHIVRNPMGGVDVIPESGGVELTTFHKENGK
jgi:hypothetical protein